MDTTVTILVALIALAGGAAAASTINALARRRVTGAEADSIVIGTADKLVHMQQDAIDRGDRERSQMEDEIAQLRSEVAQLRVDIKDERTRCDLELSSLRMQLVELAIRIVPAAAPVPHETTFPTTTTIHTEGVTP